MTSYINVKNKQGISKLASLIKQAGFDDVKVTVKRQSITLTPSDNVDLSAGLSDLKAGRFLSFKDPKATASFLAKRRAQPKKILTKRR